MNIEGAIGEWRALLGARCVLTAAEAQAAYGADTGGAKRVIPAALKITDSGDLPEVVRIAQRHGTPLYPISTGHNWGYGTALPAQDGCTIVDLSGLRRILHFDAELGVVTVEPGVTQGMLAEFLDAGGHPYMVPTTGAGPSCSLLANALERGYGITPYTDHFGAVTDLEAVLGDGTVYRTALRELGGEEVARLFKWGIGPYTAGLFTQSGFGIVTRMSIALARRPECVMSCIFSLADDSLLEPAVDRVRHALATLPGTVGGINLMNRHRVLAMAAPYPAEAVGADGLIRPAVIEAMGRQYQVAPWTGFATVYGTRRTARAARHELRAAFRGIASRMLFFTPQRARTLSRAVRWLPGRWGQRLARTAGTLARSLDLVGGRPNETALPLAYWRSGQRPTQGVLDPARDGCGILWFAPLVPMRGKSARKLVDMVAALTRAHGIEPLLTLTSLNDRVLDSTVPILFDRGAAGQAAKAQACLEALLEQALAEGFAPYRVGIDSMGHLAAEMTASGRFSDLLRQAIDPKRLIAPARYAR